VNVEAEENIILMVLDLMDSDLISDLVTVEAVVVTVGAVVVVEAVVAEAVAVVVEINLSKN
jgi:hypothetical protein